MNTKLAKQRAVVQLRDGRIGVLVYWPPKVQPWRGARVMVGGARSVAVLPSDVVRVLAPSTLARRAA